MPKKVFCLFFFLEENPHSSTWSKRICIIWPQYFFKVISLESLPAHGAPAILTFQVLEQNKLFSTVKTSPMLWPPFLLTETASSHPWHLYVCTPSSLPEHTLHFPLSRFWNLFSNWLSFFTRFKGLSKQGTCLLCSPLCLQQLVGCLAHRRNWVNAHQKYEWRVFLLIQSPEINTILC